MDDYFLFSWWESCVNKIHMIGIKRIIAFFSTVLLTCALFFAFRFYKEYRASNAVEYYVDILERHVNLISEQNQAPLTELANDIITEKNKVNGSLFEPHLNILECFALQKTNAEPLEIIKKFEKALSNLKNNNDLFKVYNLAYALYLLKSNEPTLIQRGKDILIEQAQSHNKATAAQAMFFHGWFLLLNEGLEEADAVWGNLINNPALSQSPYTELAKKARNWELM